MTTSKVAAERMDQVLAVFSAEGTKSRNQVKILLEDVLEQASKSHPTLKIKIDIEKEVEQTEIAGGRLLSMVFSNLLRNVEDYASGTARVIIHARKQENQVEFLVEDDGPGVDPSIKDKLFQAGVSTSGGGLGLYLCKRVVEGYRGSMEYIDNQKEGAAFRILLPIG